GGGGGPRPGAARPRPRGPRVRRRERCRRGRGGTAAVRAADRGGHGGGPGAVGRGPAARGSLAVRGDRPGHRRGGRRGRRAGARAESVVRAADAVDAVVVTDPARQRTLWRIREDASGTATRMPDGTEAWPGWEDCAVPPSRLGAYLRDFRGLLTAHGLRGAPCGHFGDGCIHVRIDFDLLTGPGVARFRRFSEELADLVVAHGGSLSGEHGDGQARAELLPRMYGAETV